MVVAVGLMVCADGHQAGILARGTAVGLQRHRIEAGDLRQLRRQILSAKTSISQKTLVPGHCKICELFFTAILTVFTGH